MSTKRVFNSLKNPVSLSNGGPGDGKVGDGVAQIGRDALDGFYVYDHFLSDDHDGFAAVPLRNPKQQRSFDEDGLPLCEAGLPMPLTGSFVNRTSRVQHRRGRYSCPLLQPEPNGETCPVNHKMWPDGGCKLVMPTAVGARIRYQLDRDSTASNRSTTGERPLSGFSARPWLWVLNGRSYATAMPLPTSTL